MVETEIFKWLSAGGDLSVILLLAVMWRFDRRLLALEIHVCGRGKKP